MICGQEEPDTPSLTTRAQVEADIEQLLAERFCPPEWAFLPQISNGTGASHRRTADAIAFNCYPSRGLELHGFEIKVSRSDWLRELQNPDKSIAVQRYCDRWWIVISDKKIVLPGELPPTWGLMAPHGKGLRALTPAPQLEAESLSREFIASMLRKAAAVVTPQARIDAAYRRGKQDGLDATNNAAELAIRRAHQERDDLQGSIDAFQQASGVHITRWNGGTIGAAVQAVLSHGKDPLIAIRRQRDMLAGMVESMDRSIDAFEKERRAGT